MSSYVVRKIYFKNTISSLIDFKFIEIEEKELFVISVKSSKTPVFLHNYHFLDKTTSKHFYVGRTASTTEIKDIEEIIRYIFNHDYTNK